VSAEFPNNPDLKGVLGSPPSSMFGSAGFQKHSTCACTPEIEKEKNNGKAWHYGCK